jgi:hypothetical protein
MGGMVSARALLPFYSGCRVQPSSLATIRAFCCYNTNNNLLVRHLRPLAYSAVMIRDGKQQGWLSLPVDTLPVWAAFNSVAFDGVNIGPLPGKEDRGSTVIAKRSLKGGHEPPLMTIPRDLILSLDRIHEHAKSDSDFRAVLDGLDEFGRVGVVVFYSSSISLDILFSGEYTSFIRHVQQRLASCPIPYDPSKSSHHELPLHTVSLLSNHS